MQKRKTLEWSTLFDDEEDVPKKQIFKLFSQRGIKKVKQTIKQEPTKVEKKEVKKETKIVPATLEEYALSTEDKIFIHRLEKNSILADPNVSLLPPMVDVLSYVSKMEESSRPPWFIATQNAIIEDDKRYPKLDVLTRAYIEPFLVQCDTNKGQRPCAQQQCQSELMGGFRCRELLLPNQLNTPTSTRMPGMCYLCHLACTNALFWESLNNKDAENKEMYSIHHFIVQVDIEGEYRLDKTLMGRDTTFSGLFGPFPVFNVNNYKKVQMNNSMLYTWRESDSMVFHQSPDPIVSKINTLQEEGKYLKQ